MKNVIAHLASDLRYALRSLHNAPLFTTVAVLSIGLGIGANTAVFTLVDQVVLRTMPVERPGELVQVSAPRAETLGGGIGDGSELSYAMYRDLRNHNGVFAGMFCRFPWRMQVTDAGRSEQVSGEMVSGTFFPLLGIKASAGRMLSENDDRSIGGHPVAVLSHGYWLSRFGGDPKAIGKTIIVNRHALEIVGVVEPGFAGLDIGDPTQVYVPIAMQPQMGPPWLELEGRRFRFVQAFGRLRSGMSIDGASAGLQPLYRSLLAEESKDAAFSAASPETRRRFLDGQLTVEDASRGRSGLRRAVTEPLMILMAIAAGVLLIVCANIANLLIARGAARHREVALRLAVGASRGQVVRMLLVESLCLAVAGAGLGLLIAVWGADALLGFFAQPENAIAVSAGADARILLFTSALATGTAFVAGLIPALRTTRVDLAPTLKAAGGAIVGEQPRLRKPLVVAQIGLSFLLLIAAGLFVTSLRNLRGVDPGYTTARMLSFGVDLAASGYDAERGRAFARAFQERLSRVPGVISAGYAFQELLSGGGWGMGFTVEGYTPAPGEGANAMANAVSPGFFKTMGMRLIAGREFDDRDDRGFAEGWPYSVAVVNEAFAARYFGGSNPIGRHLGFGSNPGTRTPVEIVGLVANSKYTSIREAARPQVFFPYLQATIEGLTAYIHTSHDPLRQFGAIRREVAALDPELAIFGVTSLDDRVGRSMVNERLIASLSAVLSGMATLLAVVGLYGVMAYMVGRRTREFGIRMALGAGGARIAGGVLREAAILLCAGLAVGCAAAWWLGRYVEAQLYGVQPGDSSTMLLAASALTVIAGVASALPARRAARIMPMSALREE